MAYNLELLIAPAESLSKFFSLPIKVWLVLFFLFVPCICFSTCIAIFRLGNEIFVGADSRRTLHAIDGTPSQNKFDNAYCKINKEGKFHFVIAGFADEESRAIATKACSKSRTFDMLVTNYSQNLIQEFTPILEMVRATNNKFYYDRFVNRIIGDIVFFGFENDQLKSIRITFWVTNKANEVTRIKIDTVVNEAVVFLGVKDNIESLPDDKIAALLKTGLANTVKELITMEIKAHPDKVGGPIDILRLDLQGEHWIAKKRNCE